MFVPLNEDLRINGVDRKFLYEVFSFSSGWT